jgi:hypothetical protein
MTGDLLLKGQALLSVFAVVIQIVIIIVGWDVLKLASYLKPWRVGWWAFSLGMSVAAGMRIIWTNQYLFGFQETPFLEPIMSLLMSICMLWFIVRMKRLFRSLYEPLPHGRRVTDVVPVVTPLKEVDLHLGDAGCVVTLEVRIKSISKPVSISDYKDKISE